MWNCIRLLIKVLLCLLDFCRHMCTCAQANAQTLAFSALKKIPASYFLLEYS